MHRLVQRFRRPAKRRALARKRDCAAFRHRSDRARASKHPTCVAICSKRGLPFSFLRSSRPPGPLERAMSEVEFDRVMEAVRTAVMLAPVEDLLARSLISGEPP